MDWSNYPLLEVKEGVQRGRPVLKGTRMPVGHIVENWEAGVDEARVDLEMWRGRGLAVWLSKEIVDANC